MKEYLKIKEDNLDAVSHTDIALLKLVDSFFKKHSKKNQRLLDIGLGSGVHSMIALSQGLSVCGVDIVKPRMISKKIQFKKMDLNKDVLPFKNEFDFVLCTEIIEHIENPHKLLREIRNSLKKDGLCFLSTPNIQSFYEKIYYLVKGNFRRFPVDSAKYQHINPINLVELRLLSKFSGLKIVEISTEGLWVPILRIYLNEKCRKFFKISLGESLVIILKKN